MKPSSITITSANSPFYFPVDWTQGSHGITVTPNSATVTVSFTRESPLNYKFSEVSTWTDVPSLTGISTSKAVTIGNAACLKIVVTGVSAQVDIISLDQAPPGDGSGTDYLPLSGGTITSNLTIQPSTSVSVANALLDDIVINNSLGDAGISILTGNSNVGRYGFGDAADSYRGGMYYSHSTDSLAFQVNDIAGALIFDSSTNATFNGVIRVSAGDAATPSLSLSGDTNTGLYSAGADSLGFSTGGTNRLTLSTTLTSTVPVIGPSGSAFAPAFSISGSTSTGLFSPATNTLAFSLNNGEAARFTPARALLIGGTSESSSAILKLMSTTRGFMLPSMTSAQRTAIPTPAEGLMIWNNEGKGIDVYNGVVWQRITMLTV